MPIKFSIVLFLLLVTIGCIQLKGSAPPTQYYMLEAITNHHELSSHDNLTILIEMIDFPAYLKRKQIVFQSQRNIIHFSDAYRWAVPLEENTTDVLRKNLEKMLPGARISVSPWQTERSIDRRVLVSINRFTGSPGNQTDIEVHWRIIAANGAQQSGHFIDQSPLGDGYEVLVRGLNHGLERLSLELATALIEPGA